MSFVAYKYKANSSATYILTSLHSCVYYPTEQKPPYMQAENAEDTDTIPVSQFHMFFCNTSYDTDKLPE